MTDTIRLLISLTAGAVLAAAEPPSLAVPFAAAPPPLAATADAAGWSSAALVPSLGPSINPSRTVAPVLLPTEIRLLWDADTLYVRYDCTDAVVYTPFAKHDDPLYQGDACETFIDAVGDARQWFEVQVASNGATFDSNAVLTGEPRSDDNRKLTAETCNRELWSWTGYDLEGLRAAGATRAGGWTATLAIPATAINRRLGSVAFTAGQTLHANLLRYDWSEPGADGKRALTAMNWAPVIDGCPHISPKAMGTLLLAR
jgi:hypothetical protein